MTEPRTVHLGYAVGTGEPVAVPLAHTFVTGQTQLSGKTTTLRALVVRSGCRALAFVTKRGEEFAGRRIAPYLPREGKEPIHWRLVETILASALGQRAMKYERYWLIQAAKGATSLSAVRANVVRLLAKSKGGRSEEAYTLIREYLDLVVPDMVALGAADVLDLAPGLNVMDLVAVGPQLQALVIRAALERVNQHEKGVLTVFPEAWEFAPRGRSAPAKDEAVAMARKGAVLGNYLLCDSQDLAGVETTIRQAASVWILGVQRELNELKRTIDSIPAGIAKPKSAEVATLALGQFYACWGRHAVKTYVQPDWMSEHDARAIARGEADPAVMRDARAIHRAALPPAPLPTVSPSQPDEDLDMADTKDLHEKLDKVLMMMGQLATASGGPVTVRVPLPGSQPLDLLDAEEKPAGTTPLLSPLDEEQLYQRVKARLLKESPELLQVLLARPEIVVKVERQVIEVGGDTLRGRLALLLKGGFFDQPKSAGAANRELARRGHETAAANVYRELDALAAMGFLTIEGGDNKTAKLYQAVESMRANLKEVKS